MWIHGEQKSSCPVCRAAPTQAELQGLLMNDADVQELVEHLKKENATLRRALTTAQDEKMALQMYVQELPRLPLFFPF